MSDMCKDSWPIQGPLATTSTVPDQHDSNNQNASLKAIHPKPAGEFYHVVSDFGVEASNGQRFIIVNANDP